MTDSKRAIFLSYASEDAAVVARICEVLRAAGIEVWFDQSELRGGDAWDLKIHQQIHDCALFVPVISANTASRPEGYFRLEWDLADHRTHRVARNKAFIVPVCIDKTPDSGADVPESFHRVQWTRLPDGETPVAFCERVKGLLGGAEATKADARAGAGAAPSVVLRQASRRWIVLAVAGALVVLVGGWQAWRRLAPKPVSAPLQVSATAAIVPEKSIAVLPFVDMSEKKDQEYFSDGLSEELIDRLSHNADLKVIARTSSFAFKGKNEDMRSIARALGVANLLEGSVRKAGMELRVTAQLIRASDGVHLWSESYERKLTDVFKVQQDIAAAVTKGLQAKLLAVTPSPHAVSHNIEAYNLYLRGQYFARRASNADVEQGIATLKQAIALEPDFAPARAELAYAYLYVGTFGSGESTVLVHAREQVDEALHLDPTLRSAHILRANLAIMAWDWASAQRQLDDLLASGSRDSEVLFRRGQLARALGHTDDALVYFRQGLQLDPLRVINHVQLAMLLDGMQRPTEARAAAEGAISINPTATKAHLLLGLLDLEAGQIDAAGAAIELETGEYYLLQGRAMVAFARKRTSESDAVLQQLIAKYQNNAAIQIAQVYAYRGERAKAFEWLDRSIAQRDPGLINVMTDPLFENLHGDPRFKAVLHKMNLPEG